jgi:ABC-type nitrate/sulfonate/bicarbonate transport system ATPase subunit
VDEAIFLGDRVLVMTARPGRVKLEREVELPRPREPGVVLSPAFIALKREILDAIEEEALKSFATTQPGVPSHA